MVVFISVGDKKLFFPQYTLCSPECSVAGADIHNTPCKCAGTRKDTLSYTHTHAHTHTHTHTHTKSTLERAHWRFCNNDWKSPKVKRTYVWQQYIPPPPPPPYSQTEKSAMKSYALQKKTKNKNKTKNVVSLYGWLMSRGSRGTLIFVNVLLETVSAIQFWLNWNPPLVEIAGPATDVGTGQQAC